MERLVELINRASTAGGPGVEQAIFDTVDPVTIARRIEEFISQRLGTVDHARFYRPGVGVVAGLVLADGSQIVLKVHRWNVTAERLSAVQRLQEHLERAGLPAPLPLLAPEPLGAGIATAEEMILGRPASARSAPLRRAVAQGLYDFISAARDFDHVAALGEPVLLRTMDEPLWPEPHDVRFDFQATAAGAEWIDAFALSARRRLQEIGTDRVAGHFDWRVENLGFAGPRIVAIYDWDSVCAAPEAVVVGNAAGQFSADWTTGDGDRLPSLTEMRAFVDDYERARGSRFNHRQGGLLDAANLALCAYGARCQHSNVVLHPQVAEAHNSGWIRLLRQRGERCFIT